MSCVQEFLRRRGEDIERNLDRVSLIEKALECELNTGTAQKVDTSVNDEVKSWSFEKGSVLRC